MDNFNTWFDRMLQEKPEYTKFKQNPIAYFCAEFALTDILPIYAGGLGVLAGDIVKEADELGIPFVGVSLLYKKGFFRQVITDQNTQDEQPQLINPRTAGLSLVLNTEGNVFIQSIPIQGRKVYFQVWHLKIGIVDMYFLDTDINENNEEDRMITETLYGGDMHTRLLQEILLGIGGERTLFAQGIYPSVYHMNEGHSAFAALGIVHHSMKLYKLSYQEAYEAMRKKILFTNHTLVPAGNDVFPKEMVIDHLKGYTEEVSLELDGFIDKGLTPDGQNFSMTIFALNMSFKTNAVSVLHAQKAKELWPDYTMIPITNGVNMKMWIHPYLMNKLQDIMLENNVSLEDSLNYISKGELWQIHQQLKDVLLREVLNLTGSIFDKEILTVTWARRIAQYKRPDLFFIDVPSLTRIINNIQRPVQIIIAGKPHPKDEEGKRILHNILENIKAINQSNRIVYIPNYSLSLAQMLVAGSDVWLNTPIRGYEASGTSGMKASANGVLQFSVKDGWVDEVDWQHLGWIIDADDSSMSLYGQLENDITATYYNKQNGIPEQWVDMMILTMSTVINNYSAKRMVLEYFEKMYLPSLGAQG